MSITTQTVDFVAILKYRTIEQGGRKTQVFNSGYRPQIKFSFTEMQTSGQQKFLDKDVVFPGDTVTAEIQLIVTQLF
jgi:translation elongation factor EF-Tu-like GTPase